MIIYRLEVIAEYFPNCGMLPHDPEIESAEQRLRLKANSLAVAFKRNDQQYQMRLQRLTLRSCDKETLMSAFRAESAEQLVDKMEVLTVYKSKARPPAGIAVPAGFAEARKKVKSQKEKRATKATAKYRASKGGKVRPYIKKGKQT